jgi:hypothetical protein|nr:MAG TPA: hypothetical protein [Caudoviricetes sp.]DAX26875.1 MAG TPA: hypothetical protein [Caudoviricetes sp.]
MKKQINKALSDFNIMKETETWKNYISALKKYRKKVLTDLLENDTENDRSKKDLLKFITFAIEKPEEMRSELEVQLKVIQQQERDYDFD